MFRMILQDFSVKPNPLQTTSDFLANVEWKTLMLLFTHNT